MYYQIDDNDSLFKMFWQDERDNFPRFWTDATNSKKVSWQEFKDFCAKMWKVYCVDDKALVYFEKVGHHANVHFSLMRKAKIDPTDLEKMRDEMLCETKLIFGWVVTRNRGLANMLKSLGFRHDARFDKSEGDSHGRPLQYHCYLYSRKVVEPELKSLLQSQ